MGWLTLAFWAGRIVSEARNELLTRSEGKGKERERPSRDMSTVSRQSSFWSPALIDQGHVVLAFVLAAQSLLFVLGVNAVGPVR